MQTNSLLYGLIGFFIGGLLVAIAATTFNKPIHENSASSNTSRGAMSNALKSKTGEEFDKAFIASMIAHHDGAVAMAKLSADNAKHEEIKTLSATIIAAQKKEITQMKQWQMDWGYSAMKMNHSGMDH